MHCESETRRPLPCPEPGPASAARWVGVHLADLCGDDAGPSPVFRGGQSAADAALAGFDVAGYAARRNEVWPEGRRGASRLSPYIRHGLLSLPRVWDHVAGGPARDVRKFRDELLWQEYARHLYARLGSRTARALRRPLPARERWSEELVWDRSMRCVDAATSELDRDGWLPNQTRMWLASQWSVRHGAPWRAGEDRFFRQLLDGSRAANRLGWQWTTGAAGGRPYGFSRWQVEKRAPGLCGRCALQRACPIQRWPDTDATPAPGPPPRSLRRDDDLAATAGPEHVEESAAPSGVWLSAESLGDADPALRAHPELPALFVFDAPLLLRLRLSTKRLVFLVETLSELATRRAVELYVGNPRQVLAGRPLATTFAPVPGARRLRDALPVAVLHPWPWLALPHAGTLASFSAWRRALRL